MNIKLQDNVLKSLILLLIVFLLGYASIMLVHIFFANMIDNLDAKVKNEQARYKIGQYILEEINAVEKNYYKMAIMFNKKPLNPIKNEIKNELNSIRKAIDILENGGSLNVRIELNLVDVSEDVEKITFTPSKNIKYTFEAISLNPKLQFIEDEIERMEEIVLLKNKIKSSSNQEEIEDIIFEIQLFFKQIPALFVRLKENTSRLLYEGKKNLNELEKDIKKEKKQYHTLEYSITISVMILIMILSYIVIKLILKRSKELNILTLKAKKSAREASRANEIKSQFLANMSHEIRTPLNAIIGFSDILSRAKLSPVEKEKALIINKSANSLLHIINDILDISKVESGKFELNEVKIDLKKALEQVVQLYSVNTKQKNIRFIYKLIGDIPKYIYADEVRLKQVLSNILSNAIKFTPENKSIVFEVKVLNFSGNKVRLKFLIKDEGIGISPQNQKKVFQAFSQADSGISRKFGGTGLGLAISLNIVQLMKSKIYLESEENKGSSFFFDVNFLYEKEKKVVNKYKFLLCDSKDDKEFLKDSLANSLKDYGLVFDKENVKKNDIDLIFCFCDSILLKKAKKLSSKYSAPIVFVGDEKKIENIKAKSLIDFYIDTPIYGSKVFNIIAQSCKIEKKALDKSKSSEKNSFTAKVLVAEDNPNNQLLISLLLEELGLDIDIVDNGEEAYKLYKKNKYDIVFLDINMPIMDGLNALKLIRKYEEENKLFTPMVALTANSIIGDKEKYLASGMDEYLSKPIENEKLLRILRKYLKEPSLKRNKKSKTKQKNKSVNHLSKIDLEKVSKNLGLSENIAQRIIDKFKVDIVKELNDFEQIISSENKDEIRKKAHYVKNSCLNVCLDDICKVLQEMEKSEELSNVEYRKKFELIKENIYRSIKD